MISKRDIEALLDLTGRHNKQELTAALVENVHKLAASSTIAVYEVFNTDGDRGPANNPSDIVVRNVSNSVWLGESLAQHKGFVECIASKKVVRLTQEEPLSTRIIFPVRDARNVVGLLVIDCPSDDAETLYMIEALSQVWQSQQFLLDRNEHDVLTGLFNRQALGTRMPRLFGENPGSLQSKPGTQARKCLAMLDLDNFKEVNDKYGHLFGDEVLVHFARLMNQSFRPYDDLFRYGGEEFVVFLPNVDLDVALVVLERFRKTVETYDFPRVGKITVSIGVIQLAASEMPSTLLDKADKALYYAKQNGRNRVCAYEHLVASGQLLESKVQTGDVELF